MKPGNTARRTAAIGMILIATALPVSALEVSLGVRETGEAGGPSGAIGSDGGIAGGIEWINKDGQSVPLDGVWRQYTWDLDADPVSPFAGISADGTLDGSYGTIEHLRLLNDTGVASPITLWIDYVVDTITIVGVAPVVTPVVVQDFEGFANGTEVMFQEPSFSGSTSGNLLGGSTALVDDSTAFEALASYRVDLQFVDGSPTRWVRLTTFNADNDPNPLIRFDQDSVVSLYIKGVVPEPATVLMLLSGAALLARRRRQA